jgi:hypothetical protein
VPAGDALNYPGQQAVPDVAGRIHLALIAIKDHYDTCLEPVRRAPGSHVQTTRVAPVPISSLVIDARANCRATLAYWVVFVIQGQDLHTEHLTRFDVPGMVEMLTRHVDWLGSTARGEEALEQLRLSAHELTRIAVPEDRDWMPLGPCPLVFEIAATEDGQAFTLPVPCLGTIRAYPSCDPYCDACLTSGIVQWWERQMFGDLEPLKAITAPELVLAIHREYGRLYSEITIRTWERRKLIRSVGKDTGGRNLYNRVDVLLFVASRAAS